MKLKEIKSRRFFWSLKKLSQSILQLTDGYSNPEYIFDQEKGWVRDDSDDIRIAKIRSSFSLARFLNIDIDNKFPYYIGDITLEQLENNLIGPHDDGYVGYCTSLIEPGIFEFEIAEYWYILKSEIEKLKNLEKPNSILKTSRSKYVEMQFEEVLNNEEMIRLFVQKNYSYCLLEGLKLFESQVKSRLPNTKFFGRNLMAEAFKVNGKIKISEDIQEQEGYMYLTFGLYSDLIRNKLSHIPFHNISEGDCLDLISTINFLIKQL